MLRIIHFRRGSTTPKITTARNFLFPNACESRLSQQEKGNCHDRKIAFQSTDFGEILIKNSIYIYVQENCFVTEINKI